MIDFEPDETPFGTAVLTSFYIRGNMYVVDLDGYLFQIDTEGDDPNLWCWTEVIRL
jgi:hypothetical protein